VSTPETVALVTLGCARNEVDSEELAGRLTAAGWTIVDDPASASAVLVNTCGFVEVAKKDSIDAVLAAADLKGLGGGPQTVVAVGCLSERYGAELAESLPEADAVLGFDDYPDIAERLRSIVGGTPHVPHAPKDRRHLLPISPVDRDAAAAGIIARGIKPQFKAERYGDGITAGVRGILADFAGLNVSAAVAGRNEVPWQTIAIAVAAVALAVLAMNLLRSGRSGWGWLTLALCGGAIFALQIGRVTGVNDGAHGLLLFKLQCLMLRVQEVRRWFDNGGVKRGSSAIGYSASGRGCGLYGREWRL
jgi:hypothetical protein